MGQRIDVLPLGYAIGQRVVTNECYALCHRFSPQKRLGTILGGSKGNDGPILVKLDDQKYAKPMPLKWVDVVD